MPHIATAGPSIDMHYQGNTYLSLLDKRKECGSMSSPFLTEPVALWIAGNCKQNETDQSAANKTTKHPHTPNSSQTVTTINRNEPSWELQIILL